MILSPYQPDEIKTQDVKDKKAQIKASAETYGTKGRINYLSGSRLMQELLNTSSRKAGTVALVPPSVGFLWGVHAAVGTGREKAAAVVTAYMAGNAVLKAGMAYTSRARSESEKAKFDDYAELRPAQFVLKRLKKEILKNQQIKDEGRRPTLSTLIVQQAPTR